MFWNWYDDENSLAHVATYKNAGEASSDAERAARKGWIPQGSTATEGHVNIGRTTMKVLALGLPFLVTGASRTKGNLTITYVRTPDWLANRQRRSEAKTQAEAARKAEQQAARAEQRAESERRRAEEKSARASSRALQGVTRGHVTREQPTYGSPDIFGRPTGVLGHGSAFDLVEMSGAFARVRTALGADVWIALSAIRPGEPEVTPDVTRPSAAAQVSVVGERRARFCEQCGNGLGEAARFCRSCGAPVGPGSTDDDSSNSYLADRAAGAADRSRAPVKHRRKFHPTGERGSAAPQAAAEEPADNDAVNLGATPTHETEASSVDARPQAETESARSEILDHDAPTAAASEGTAHVERTIPAEPSAAFLSRPPLWFKAFVVVVALVLVTQWLGPFGAVMVLVGTALAVSAPLRGRSLALVSQSERVPYVRDVYARARGLLQAAVAWWNARPRVVQGAYVTVAGLFLLFVLLFATTGVGPAAVLFALTFAALVIAAGLLSLALVAWVPRLGSQVLTWVGWNELPRLGAYGGFRASAALVGVAVAALLTGLVSAEVGSATSIRPTATPERTLGGSAATPRPSVAQVAAPAVPTSSATSRATPTAAQTASAPPPTPKPLYRADQVILPPEQFPLSGYRVTADAAEGTGWKRDFTPGRDTPASPRISVVVRVLSSSEAADPAAYFSANGVCGGRTFVVLPTTEGGLLSCQVQDAHDATGHQAQLGVLALSDPVGYGGFSEQVVVGRYLVFVTAGLGDATGANAGLMSRAMLTVAKTQVDLIVKLTQ